MKKLLLILASLGLAGTASMSVVACGNNDNNKIGQGDLTSLSSVVKNKNISIQYGIGDDDGANETPETIKTKIWANLKTQDARLVPSTPDGIELTLTYELGSNKTTLTAVDKANFFKGSVDLSLSFVKYVPIDASTDSSVKLTAAVDEDKLTDTNVMISQLVAAYKNGDEANTEATITNFTVDPIDAVAHQTNIRFDLEISATSKKYIPGTFKNVAIAIVVSRNFKVSSATANVNVTDANYWTSIVTSEDILGAEAADHIKLGTALDASTRKFTVVPKDNDYFYSTNSVLEITLDPAAIIELSVASVATSSEGTYTGTDLADMQTQGTSFTVDSAFWNPTGTLKTITKTNDANLNHFVKMTFTFAAATGYTGTYTYTLTSTTDTNPMHIIKATFKNAQTEAGKGVLASTLGLTSFADAKSQFESALGSNFKAVDSNATGPTYIYNGIEGTIFDGETISLTDDITSTK